MWSMSVYLYVSGDLFTATYVTRVLGSVMSVDRLPPADANIVSAANKTPLELEPQFDIHRWDVKRYTVHHA